MRTFDLTAALGDRANQPEISRLLVAQLMTSNNEDTRKLRRAQEREQTQELNELAHRLAGMASLIHAHAVERACHQLEIACGESSVRKLADAVDDLVTALGELQCPADGWPARAPARRTPRERTPAGSSSPDAALPAAHGPAPSSAESAAPPLRKGRGLARCSAHRNRREHGSPGCGGWNTRSSSPLQAPPACNSACSQSTKPSTSRWRRLRSGNTA